LEKLQSRWKVQLKSEVAGRRVPAIQRLRSSSPAAIVLALIATSGRLSAAQADSGLPDAPQPLSHPDNTAASTACQVEAAGAATAIVAAAGALAETDSRTVATTGIASPAAVQRGTQCAAPPRINWYTRFTNGPQVKPLTPEEKGWLALRNLVDPFNLVTIFGDSGIAIASNSHSPYGPGWTGFAKNAGVSFTQDATGEFFDTFVICSIAHQDPHYHRMPHASIPRRATHAVLQVIWTQGDNGRGMPNYANIVGFAIDDEIGNLYVPGQATNLPSSAERYAVGLATAPIDNFVTEFVPDIASHIHVQIVVIQRIINQVAKTTSNGDTP
jgi:hypothetical protein